MVEAHKAEACGHLCEDGEVQARPGLCHRGALSDPQVKYNPHPARSQKFADFPGPDRRHQDPPVQLKDYNLRRSAQTIREADPCPPSPAMRNRRRRF